MEQLSSTEGGKNASMVNFVCISSTQRQSFTSVDDKGEKKLFNASYGPNSVFHKPRKTY